MSDLREVLQENSYLRQKQLIFADCDRYQRARVSTLLSIAAAVAGADYDARGLTYEKLYEMREVFLLSRIALRIHRCPRALQVVDVTTWEDGVKAAHMQRVYEITDREGLLVSIRSDWILVDPQTRRIMRPGTFTAKKLGTCPKAIDAPEPRKILLPREGVEDLGDPEGGLVRPGRQRPCVQRQLRRLRLGLPARGPAGKGAPGVLHQLQQGSHPGPGAADGGLPQGRRRI